MESSIAKPPSRLKVRIKLKNNPLLPVPGPAPAGQPHRQQLVDKQQQGVPGKGEPGCACAGPQQQLVLPPLVLPLLTRQLLPARALAPVAPRPASKRKRRLLDGYVGPGATPSAIGDWESQGTKFWGTSSRQHSPQAQGLVRTHLTTAVTCAPYACS